MSARLLSGVVIAVVLAACSAGGGGDDASGATGAAPESPAVVESDAAPASNTPVPPDDAAPSTTNAAAPVPLDHDQQLAEIEAVGDLAYADCPTETFVDVEAFRLPGAAGPAPVLDVTCDDATMAVSANGIPHLDRMALGDRQRAESTRRWTIPLAPEFADPPVALPSSGPIAVAVNGVAIAAPDGGDDPVRSGAVDVCRGRDDGEDGYRFHGLVESCLLTTPGLGVDAASPSPVLGWAPDGHAIHGDRGCLDLACTIVVRFVSGYQEIGDPTADGSAAYEHVPDADPVILDECNGRVGPDGVYRYHATERYPYVPACFRGVPTGAIPGSIPGSEP